MQTQKLDLLEERKRLELKRVDVAREMGIHENRLYDWENGIHIPALKSAVRLLEVLNGIRVRKGLGKLLLEDFNWQP